MSIENLYLFLDAFHTVVEIFCVPNWTKYVVSNFPIVWPISGRGNQVPLINLCLVELSFAQESSVSGLTSNVGGDGVALKDESPIIEFEYRELSVCLFCFEISGILLFFTENFHFQLWLWESCGNECNEGELVVDSVSVKFCHVCVILVSIME